MSKRSNSRYNSLFKKISRDNKEFFLTQELYELLKDGFIEVDDCIYFSRFAPEGKWSIDFTDRTGNEAFYNKIQIDDYCDFDNFNMQFLLGQHFVETLSKKLRICFPNETLKILYTCDDKYCNVTFHKKRYMEEYLSEDLEEYSLEGVLELTIDSKY